MGSSTARAIRYERDCKREDMMEVLLERAVTSFATLPLSSDYRAAVIEHMIDHDWKDAMYDEMHNVIITIALGGTVTAKDVANILTLEMVQDVIREQLLKGAANK